MDKVLEKIKQSHNKHVNIYIGGDIPEDINLFFGDDTTPLIHYKNNLYWDQVLRDIGVASSTSEAKGSGWHKLVEKGFQDIYLNGLGVWRREGFGLRPHRITVLNELE